MEELMTNEVKDITEAVVDECTNSGNGIRKIVVAGTVVVVAGVGALVYKNRTKLDEMRIKKLEKKGYIVYRPEVCQYESDDSDTNEESDK